MIHWRYFWQTVSTGILLASFVMILGELAIPSRTFAQGSEPGGVAVLNDGRVFQGKVEEVPGGYRVQYPGGSSILPFNQISVTAATLVEAYEAFRDSITTPNADSHLRLAEWCLANGLYAQAEMEVQSALRLEPARRDAAVILKQIDAILRPGTPSTQTSPTVTTPVPASRAAMNVTTFTAPGARRPSGLSRETQLEYMRKVQPLLMNKCGNAGCHGAEVDNGLKLMNARTYSAGLRMATEHNLEMIFSFIDDERPTQSPLLQKPREQTTPHAKLFAARWQQPQYQILEQWVTKVSRERSVSTPIADSPSPPVRSELQSSTSIRPAPPIQQVSANVTATGSPSVISPESVPSKTVAPAGKMPSATLPGLAGDPAFLEQFRQAQRPDAFDPEIFNRMMHGSKIER